MAYAPPAPVSRSRRADPEAGHAAAWDPVEAAHRTGHLGSVCCRTGWMPRGLSRPKGHTLVDLVQAGDRPPAAARSSSAWISPAHSDTNEIVGIGPVVGSSVVWTQPAQAEPGGCAETRTKSWELA